jgi:hypothetical protein
MRRLHRNEVRRRGSRHRSNWRWRGYGASSAASMAPNPTMKTKKVLMSIVDPFGVSRKSIHSR